MKVFHLLPVACLTILILPGPCPADDAPAATVQLGTNTNYQFVPPPADAWEPVKQQAPTISAFTSKSHDAIIALQLLPGDMVISDAVKAKIIQQLKANRQKTKTKMAMEPTEEPDERFALVVHERYEVAAKPGAAAAEPKISDQLHIYRKVGNRLVMCTVNSVAGDADKVKDEQKVAQDALLSVSAQAGAKKPATRTGK